METKWINTAAIKTEGRWVNYYVPREKLEYLRYMFIDRTRAIWNMRTLLNRGLKLI